MRKLLRKITEEYIYDSPEEKERHCKEMTKRDFTDSGQIKINLAQNILFDKPQWVYYGLYYKEEQM